MRIKKNYFLFTSRYFGTINSSKLRKDFYTIIVNCPRISELNYLSSVLVVFSHTADRQWMFNLQSLLLLTLLIELKFDFHQMKNRMSFENNPLLFSCIGSIMEMVDYKYMFNSPSRKPSPR